MNRPVATLKCLSVIAQVTMRYFDEDGNLLKEELFPPVDGKLLTAKLFHPQVEQVEKLMETCVDQAWAKLGGQRQARASGPYVSGAVPEGEVVGILQE